MKSPYFAVALMLVLITIGLIIIISIAIIIKRRVAKRKGRIGRAVYTPFGCGLSKIWRENIEKKINATVKIRTEPHVYGPSYAEKYNTMPNGEIGVTFIYRAKTVDKFLELKNAILAIDPTLESPPLRNIRDFLLTARHHAMSPPASCDRINEYCKLYLWARHDLNPYGESEHIRFCELHNRFMELVTRANVAHIHPIGSGSALPSHGGQSSKLNISSRISPGVKVNFPHFMQSSSQDSTSSTHSSKPEQSRSARLRALPKSSTSGLVLRRITNAHRKKQEPLVVSQPGIETTSAEKCQVFTNDIDVTDSTIDLRPVTSAATTSINQQSSTSRRGSCRSDGSQTALIDFDSIILNPKSPTQSVRPTRLVEPYLQSELKTTMKYIKGEN